MNDHLLNQGQSSPFYFPIGSLASFDSRHKHYSRTEIDAFSRIFSNQHDIAIIDVIKRRKLSKFMMKKNAVHFEAIVNASIVDLKRDWLKIKSTQKQSSLLSYLRKTEMSSCNFMDFGFLQ